MPIITEEAFPPNSHRMSSDDHHFRCPGLVYSFCRLRAKKLAMLVHATSGIPLSDKLIVGIEERMFRNANFAVDDDDVTKRVNDVQDAFISETHFRTLAMWKFCRKMAVTLAFRLGLESKMAKRKNTLLWRIRTSRSLCRRMFRVASRAANDDDANARIGNVYNAALVEHGIAVDED
jgi:hypothetical protein